MSLKPDYKTCVVAEQIIEDPVTGLTFQFEVAPSTDAPYRLRIYGDKLPFGNREILFDPEGVHCAAGTYTTGLCKPAWLTKIDEL